MDADSDSIVTPMVRNSAVDLQQNLGGVVHDNPTDQTQTVTQQTNYPIGRGTQSDGSPANLGNSTVANSPDGTPQNTQTNVPIGRDTQTVSDSDGSSLQDFSGPAPRYTVTFVGVGNPNVEDAPQMDFPLDVNPLAITNQSGIGDATTARSFVVSKDSGDELKQSVATASSLQDALNNAGTNVSTKLINQGLVSEKVALKNGEKNNLSTQEQSNKNGNVRESANAGPQGQTINIRLEGATEIKQAAETLASVVKETQKSPTPNAKVSGTEATQAVQESFAVKEQARFDRIAKAMRSYGHALAVSEDISASGASGALGQVWSPDMIGTAARPACKSKEICPGKRNSERKQADQLYDDHHR